MLFFIELKMQLLLFQSVYWRRVGRFRFLRFGFAHGSSGSRYASWFSTVRFHGSGSVPEPYCFWYVKNHRVWPLWYERLTWFFPVRAMASQPTFHIHLISGLEFEAASNPMVGFGERSYSSYGSLAHPSWFLLQSQYDSLWSYLERIRASSFLTMR